MIKTFELSGVTGIASLPLDDHLWLDDRQLVAVSDEIAQCTRVFKLTVRSRSCIAAAAHHRSQLRHNAFAEVPRGVLAMSHLRFLNVRPLPSALTVAGLTRGAAEQQ